MTTKYDDPNYKSDFQKWQEEQVWRDEIRSIVYRRHRSPHEAEMLFMSAAKIIQDMLDHKDKQIQELMNKII